MGAEVESCYLGEYMQVQIPAMKDAIREDKWYLSENAGHDVGDEAAKRDFVDNWLDVWAAEFRRDYCSGRCEHRECCKAKYRFLGNQ